MSYPTNLSNIPELTATDTMDAHLTVHNTEIQALNQLEAKVGIDGSADTDSIDYKINHLTLADVTDVTASVAEINYVDGVTSAIQTQLNAKQAVVANVSDTEIGYLDGVTSSIQTQINGKQAVASSSSITSSATPTPTGDAEVNELYITALAAAAEFQEPSGTPVNGNRLLIRVKDDGTARALTYNAIYDGLFDTLPTTTTLGKTLYMLFLYNSTATKWEMVAMTEEA